MPFSAICSTSASAKARAADSENVIRRLVGSSLSHPRHTPLEPASHEQRSGARRRPSTRKLALARSVAIPTRNPRWVTTILTQGDYPNDDNYRQDDNYRKDDDCLEATTTESSDAKIPGEELQPGGEF